MQSLRAVLVREVEASVNFETSTMRHGARRAYRFVRSLRVTVCYAPRRIYLERNVIVRLSRLTIAALLSVTLGGANAASDRTATGSVLGLDSAKCTITLDDRSAYQFGQHCDFSKLKVGEKIAIIWRQNGDLRQAVQVFVST